MQRNELLSHAITWMESLDMRFVRVYGVSNFPQPIAVGTQFPDLTAQYRARYVIASVGTYDVLSEPYLLDLWRIFAREASRRGGLFIPIVEQSDVAYARHMLLRAADDSRCGFVWAPEHEP